MKHLFKVVNQFITNLPQRLAGLFLITTLSMSLVSPIVADEVRVPGKQFFELLARNQAIQLNNSEKNAIIWEVDGDAYCSHTPPAGIKIAFQFADSNRWSSSGTNPGPLSQGDPMVLTYSFVPDGPQGAGFTCGVPGEVAGADSNLIAFLDSTHGDGPGGTDLTLRPWFPIFKSAFDNWGILNGVKYVYEPNDDGAAMGRGGALGVLGTRGDLRIGGHFIDGQVGSNVLACNYFPNNGDMIIDTGNIRFYGPNPPQHRGFRNVLEHEHGHGMGISHVCPINRSKLMEPFISTTFLGAQEDDILAANRGYGDRDEFPTQNDTPLTATPLGAIAINQSVTRAQVSIDDNSDQDFYSFIAPTDAQVNITLTPKGSTYLNGPQNNNGSCSAGSNFNSLIENDLGFELLGQSGMNVLADADSAFAGEIENIFGVALNEGEGRYFVRIFGAQPRTQMYDLNVELTGIPAQTDDSCFTIKSSHGKVITFCF